MEGHSVRLHLREEVLHQLPQLKLPESASGANGVKDRHHNVSCIVEVLGIRVRRIVLLLSLGVCCCEFSQLLPQVGHLLLEGVQLVSGGVDIVL